MSAYEQLRTSTDDVSSAEDISESAAALWVMTVKVMQMSGYIPIELRRALFGAVERWYLRSQDAPKLEPWRVRCWQFLEARHGNSSTVADRVDVAVRGLISVLCDDEMSADEVDDTLGYLGSVLDGPANELAPGDQPERHPRQ